MPKTSAVWPCAKIEDVPGYFEELKSVIEASPKWRFVKELAPPTPTIAVKYMGSDFDGEGLQFCVFDAGRPKGLVNFGCTADVWPVPAPWNGRQAKQQIRAAFKLFRPVAAEAARRCGMALKIQLPKPRHFELPPKTKALIDSFVVAANLELLHASDWERFYRIVHHAHRYGVDMWRW